MGLSPKALDSAITVTPVRDTQLLQIKVEGPNREMIAKVANTLPEVFIQRNAEMQLGRVMESKIKLEEEIAGTETDLADTQRDCEPLPRDLHATALQARR